MRRTGYFDGLIRIISAAALLVAVSCDRSGSAENKTTSSSFSSPASAPSSTALVVDEAKQDHESPEQSLEPEESTKAGSPSPPPPVVMHVRQPSRAAKNIDAQASPDPETTPTMVLMVPALPEREKSDGTTPPPRPPVLVFVPPPPLAPSPRIDVVPAPAAEPNGNFLNATDVVLLVGSVSIIVGTTALANGSGEEGPGAFGLSMLGVGLASYGTAGILAWRERSPSSSSSSSSSSTLRVTVGPGVVRGTF
jgi:hypothetical protein